MASADIVGILLAAGNSSRFGSDKLLHPLADGTPMAIAAARMLRTACTRCVSVLRPEQQQLGELLAAEGYTVHYSTKAHQGMGRSLATAVQSEPAAAGWLVALADMPFVDPVTASLVIYALRGGASLAAPFFEGQRGLPVGFSKMWFTQLASLRGDRGARDLLADNPDVITQVPCGDRGILTDIDTPAALDWLPGQKTTLGSQTSWRR
jgi:molybdenum cofactor cytidylyltransferase